MRTRLLLIASLVSVFVGCGDDKSENGAQNDGGGGGDGALDGASEGGGIDVGPAPPGFELVADLNTRKDTALPYDTRFLEALGKVFFIADDGVHGLEPIVSDGTAAGTKLLKDLAPGSEDGSARGFIAKGDKLYFFGTKDTSSALYRSDGTPEGTTAIINNAQGGEFAFPIGERLCFLGSSRLECTDAAVTTLTKVMDVSGSFNQALSLGARAVFSSSSALWTTDGVTATKLVDVEIKPGGVVVGGKAVFWAENSGQLRPYMSDGTLAGSRPLADITASSSATTTMIALGSKVLTVNAGDAVILDPTAISYTKLADLNVLGAFGIGGGKALLSADRRSASPSIGAELWVTDGTDAGTTFVRELNPGSSGTTISWLGSIGSAAYFTAYDATAMVQNLWKSDGTDPGTVKIGEWKIDARSDRPGWTSALGRLVFGCADATSWKTLCTLDASGKTTVIPVNAATAPSTPTAFALLGERLFFNANDGEEPVSNPIGSMFVSDGTAAGTKRVGARFSGKVAALGTKTFFTRVGAEGADKWELASFDGDPTAATTVAPFNFKANFDYARGFPLVSFAGKVWFAANPPSGAISVYSSDGTLTGTKSMSYTPSANYSEYGGPTWPIVGPAMYVPTNEGVMVVDSAGTMTPLAGATGKIGALDGADGRIWFSIGGTLWVSDGTPAGTTMVKAITTSTSNPIWRIIAINKSLAYVFTNSGSSPAVYSSDGTATGTKLVASMPNWTRYKDGLAFSNSSGISVVSPTKPTPIEISVRSGTRLLGAGDRLFFASSDESRGEELWTTDGTVLGTKAAGDLRAGKPSSTPTPQAFLGSYLYFTAEDGARGTELWRYKSQ